MLPDRVSNSGPLTYESDALPIALRGPAIFEAVQSPNKLGISGTLFRIKCVHGVGRLSSSKTISKI